MSVGSLTTNVSFLLGCTTAVSTCYILFLLCFSLDLRLIFLWPIFCSTPESDAIQDYRIDIVASMSHIIDL